jgi:hypothetical protein
MSILKVILAHHDTIPTPLQLVCLELESADIAVSVVRV